MIEILLAKKIKIDLVSKKEEFLVCEKKDSGELLIMGLIKYLKLGRRNPEGGGVVIKKLGQEKRER